MLLNYKHTGVFFALLILSMWLATTFFLFRVDVDFSSPWIYLAILLQTHLYTGLFITAHDAMHRTVSANKTINNLLGGICVALYAAFSYRKLYVKHHEHHQYVHTEKDPDYSQGNFITWYFKFMKTYLSVLQLVIIAVVYNVLALIIPQTNLLLFWVLPSLLSTVQLFYFGTYLPHKGEHENKHHARSQSKNHLYAFITCYFFGYHYEHHDSPATPWWRLHQKKN